MGGQKVGHIVGTVRAQFGRAHLHRQRGVRHRQLAQLLAGKLAQRVGQSSARCGQGPGGVVTCLPCHHLPGGEGIEIAALLKFAEFGRRLLRPPEHLVVSGAIAGNAGVQGRAAAG